MTAPARSVTMSRAALAVVAFAILLSGCTAQPGGSSPQPTIVPASPTDQPTPAATPTTAQPTPSASPGAAFYLRGWYTQSIPAQYTFGWLPPVTIANGIYINGNVAVPAIFPGPLLIQPVARTINDAGIQAITDDAKSLGLLAGSGDFTGSSPKPGAKLAQLELVIDGVKHELVGDPSLSVVCDRGRCSADPGTPEAFTAFWNEINMLDLWMPDNLGSSAQYEPERIALLLSVPADTSTMSPAPVLVDWPLDTPLAQAGDPYPGDDTARCLTLSGADLATMLPILESANQLTLFSEGSTVRQPAARVLVPEEPSPCLPAS